MKACLLLLSLVLAACMSAPESATHANAPATDDTGTPALSAALMRHHWELRDAVDGDNKRIDALFGKAPPLQIDFTAGRVNASHACNRIGAAYTIVEGHLVTTDLMQTRMACSDPTLMKRDAIITSVLQGRPMLILTSDSGSPLLTLAAESGQSLTFAGKPSNPADTPDPSGQP